VGRNVFEFDEFDKEVKMWVFEEMVNGEKLTDIINSRHENVK
jgi:glycerol-3-phosphate dehydrogenase (NAD+)